MARMKTRFEYLHMRIKESFKKKLKEASEEVDETMTEYVEKSVEMRISGNGKEKKA